APTTTLLLLPCGYDARSCRQDWPAPICSQRWVPVAVHALIGRYVTVPIVRNLILSRRPLVTRWICGGDSPAYATLPIGKPWRPRKTVAPPGLRSWGRRSICTGKGPCSIRILLPPKRAVTTPPAPSGWSAVSSKQV